MTVGVELDYLNGERFGKYKALALSSIIPPMQSKNSKCLSIWPETFFCQECSSALGSSTWVLQLGFAFSTSRSSDSNLRSLSPPYTRSYSPQTHRPGGCFLMPPPSIGGIQVIFTGSRGQNMPPGVEKVCRIMLL